MGSLSLEQQLIDSSVYPTESPAVVLEGLSRPERFEVGSIIQQRLALGALSRVLGSSDRETAAKVEISSTLGQGKIIQLSSKLVHLERKSSDVSSVADICGSVVRGDTGEPLAGILVDGGSLGISTTDAEGGFIFRNVALDTLYVLTPIESGLSFSPQRATGVCSEVNFQRFSTTCT